MRRKTLTKQKKPLTKRLFLYFLVAGLLIVLCGIFSKTYEYSTSTPVKAAEENYAIRFYGNGVSDIDRVKIPIANKVNVGNADFTIEWWMKALNQNNTPRTSCSSSNDGWINGNIIVDRDIWGNGDFGDYGISLFNGRVAFGVNNGSSGITLCGTKNVADNIWHHVAVTRRRSDGTMSIFIDGLLDQSVNGPDGDISYRTNRTSAYTNDPFLVLGAEKHDAGREYPSYNGFLDDFRISANLRYTSSFIPPVTTFTDNNTLLLYSFNEGTGTVVYDDATNGLSPVNGQIRYGGSPAGPVFAPSYRDVPNGTPTMAQPTIIPTTTTMPTAVPTATMTPKPTAITPQPSPTITPTPSSAGNTSLLFDGSNDRTSPSSFSSLGSKTIELFIRPTSSAQTSLVVANTTNTNGWSLEMNAGRIEYWVGLNNTWANVLSSNVLQANRWYWIVVTHDTSARNVAIYVDGILVGNGSVGNIGAVSSFFIGGMTGFPYFRGNIDELRISNGIRYTTIPSVPKSPLVADGDTVALYHFDNSPNQQIIDSSGMGRHLWRGGANSTQTSDPQWNTIVPF